jgi:hypothetical protein
MRILHNHLGYQSTASKNALVRSSAVHAASLAGRGFSLINADQRSIVFQGKLKPLGTVAQWRDWQFWEADFSEVKQAGKYVLLVDEISPPLMSQPFSIAPVIYDGQHISDLVHYLKSQRCGGMFEAADYARPKLGSEHKVDVHGGWYDASGDASKYLSHLSYANFMNPQQTPQVVWNLLDGYARMPKQSVWLDDRMIDEALHGADFLMRMLDADGYFYMTVFDRWSKDVAQRDICSYTTQQGHKFDSYQSGYRQGAGSAIAALARASQLQRDGSFTRTAYLAAAERAFAHLEMHNLSYLDDGTENIIDDYCALLAATELFAASRKAQFALAAEKRAQNLLQRQSADGWFWANDEKTRSYFHAAEAGLPYIALLRWMEVMPDSLLFDACLKGLQAGLRHEIVVSFHEGANPFRYPRQHVQMPGKQACNQFFIPHENESGYWWQGENARLGSLASAAQWAKKYLAGDQQLCAELEQYASACLHWIFGFNPFDACMMQGIGHNNPQYAKGFWNAPGGVCNGITSGQDNEQDIDFRMPEQSEPMHSWRWSEQWIPHGAWLFHALAHQLKDDAS